MSKRKAPEDFAGRLFALLADGPTATDYRQITNEAYNRLLEAQAEATEAHRDRKLTYTTAKMSAASVARKFEAAEKDAKKALAVAQEGKRRALAIADLLDTQHALIERHQKEKQQEALVSRNDGEERSNKDTDTEAAGGGGVAEGCGDEGASKAA